MLIVDRLAAEEAIRATVASGIRSVFCYCPTPRAAQWQPTLSLAHDMFPDWIMQTMSRLSGLLRQIAEGRVTMGFALDGTHLPPQFLHDILQSARKNGAEQMTFHAVHGNMFNGTYLQTIGVRAKD
jgi:hypothetical protein